ncbi:DUF4900 domain-containing protein [Thermus scotoductus]|uniref:DUF4900 domain-containing protein n=1 Tax=Thermus scotoductus TaxID=37636 RepID=UPI000570ED19|nr:DUF4900 domain-containing protein [Thermus scotoductus]
MKSKGIAIVLALATLVVISGIGTLIFLRTLGEIRHSGQDQAIVQTLMLARGAANVGGNFLSTTGRQKLDALVRQTASSTDAWAYGGNTQGPTPDPVGVAQALSGLAQQLQGQLDPLLCGVNLAPGNSAASVRLRVYFTPQACGTPLPGSLRLPPGRFVEGSPRTGAGTATSQTYALPFVMVAEASMGQYRRNIVLQGEYRFTVGRSSFARYALFTNVHTLPDGTDIWFTDRTLFDGPVHTNQHFRFYRKPWFGGEVTSAGCTNPGTASCQGQTRPGAYFYGQGFVLAGNMQPNASQPSYTNRYGTHAPEFTAGVDWNASFIPLPQNSQDQEAAAQAGGLYYQNDIQTLRLSRKCVDNITGQEVPCTPPLPAGVSKYQYIEVTYCQNSQCRQTASETYRYGEDGILYQYQTNPRPSWQQVLRNGNPVRFNGVIFTGGKVQNLLGPNRTDPNDPATASPALAEFAQITVTASGDVKIGNDLKYESPPCSGTPTRRPDGTVVPPTCDNLAARNVLGVYSQGGNVWISRNAPRNLYVHATLMSARGVVSVEDYDQIADKGNVHLLGGIIEYYYGAFGTFNSQTGQNSTGYGRAFTYDRRFLQGLAPPFFPTTGRDQVTSVSVFSYGQREQVY